MRLRLRFSLLALMISVSVACLILGWIGAIADRARARHSLSEL